ncbi:MAG: hypothetical protein ACTHMG_07310, partial [Sphingomonas sp.]
DAVTRISEDPPDTPLMQAFPEKVADRLRHRRVSHFQYLRGVSVTDRGSGRSEAAGFLRGFPPRRR